MKKIIRNILVVRNDRFGEFLLNIPAIRALKETYPQASIILAVGPEVKGLAEAVEYADKVVIWNTAFIKNLSRQEIDICVVLNPTKEAHLAAFLAGIPLRVGYSRKWGFLLTHKMPDKKDLGLKHEIESNLELVSLIGAKTIDRSIGLARLPVFNNPEYAGAVAVHPYTSDAVKQWPLERFMELAGRIAQELKSEDRGQSPSGTVPSESKVVLVGRVEVGAPPYRSGGCPAFRRRTVPSGVIDLINKTGLVELAQALKQCRLLVTGDSGPMHLAAAVGTPVIALFRNDLQGKTAKRWGPWGKGHIVIEKTNLNDITVDEIFDIVRNKLRGQSPSGTVPSGGIKI